MKLYSFIKLLLLTCIIPVTLYAQPKVSYSDAFPEPREGQDFLYILSNGNTVWMHIDNTLAFKVYDAARSQILNKTIVYKPQMGTDSKLSFGIKEAFENNGNLVVFVQRETAGAYGTFRNVERTLFRVIINPNNGEAKEFTELANSDIIKRNGYDITEMVSNDIHVAKDPITGNYAVLRTNGYTEKGTDRIKVWVYNPDNQLVKEAVVNTPANDKKFIHLTGFTFCNNAVYIGTTEDDAKQSKNYNIPYYLSKLSMESSSFETKELPLNPSHINSKMVLKYHPKTNVLYLVTSTKKKGEMIAGITLINPNTLSIDKSEVISNNKLAGYSMNNLNDKNGFEIEECDLLLNPDGSVLVVTESTFEKAFSTGKSSYTKTYTEKIGLIAFDRAGNEVRANAIRVRPDAIVSGASGSYYSYMLQNIKGDQYLFINDIDENFNNDGKEQYKMISSISDANTIVYKIQGGKIEKSYLFGKPTGKNDSRFAMIGKCYYSESNNTLVTIITDRKNNVKTSKLAWAEF